MSQVLAARARQPSALLIELKRRESGEPNNEDVGLMSRLLVRYANTPGICRQ